MAQASNSKKDINADLLTYTLNDLERTLKRLDTLEITGEVNVEHYTDIMHWIVRNDQWRRGLEYHIMIYNKAHELEQGSEISAIPDLPKTDWMNNKAIK